MAEDHPAPPRRPYSRVWTRWVPLLSLALAGAFITSRQGELYPGDQAPVSLAFKRSSAPAKKPTPVPPPAEEPVPGPPLGERHAPRDTAWAALLGATGAAAAMSFAGLGASYGMTKSALGVVSLVNLAPSAMFRGMAPVVMAELLAIYGFISGLNILSSLDIATYNSFAAYMDLGAGLTVGISCLLSGLAIGAVADANLKAYGLFTHRAESAQESKKAKAGPPHRGLAQQGGAGYGTDVFADTRPERSAEEERQAASRIFTAMILMLIFAEGLGLYGMIVGLLLHSGAGQDIPMHILQPPSLAGEALSPCGSTVGAIFGGLGIAMSIGGALAGAASGIARAGVGAAHLGVRCPERLLRGTTPVIMAELLAIYGFVVALIIALNINPERYTAFSGYLDLAAGCTSGFGCLAAGLAIGVLGDAGNRAYSKQPRVFVALVLMLIFAEALGLYGLIVGLTLHNIGVTGQC